LLEELNPGFGCVPAFYRSPLGYCPASRWYPVLLRQNRRHMCARKRVYHICPQCCRPASEAPYCSLESPRCTCWSQHQASEQLMLGVGLPTEGMGVGGHCLLRKLIRHDHDGLWRFTCTAHSAVYNCEYQTQPIPILRALRQSSPDPFD